MTHIVEQTIPTTVINNDQFIWNPNTNEVKDLQGNIVSTEREQDTRYKMMLSIVEASMAMDQYYPAAPTMIERAFNGSMELSDEQIEEMFTTFISSPEVKQVAEIIKERIGRDLEPFDIWYSGFKNSGGLSEENLNDLTRRLYPTPAAYQAALPAMMVKLGFTAEKAAEVCQYIEVDPARGSGHAWGAMMKEDLARLRCRIGDDGLDYKGYNIGTHEFGHNVEQTITMNDVDNYFMAGVPSTAFTEAVAFIFQTRDLQLLGYDNTNPDAEALKTLDIFWGSYEIMGVALVDLYTWRWLYENPGATPEDLKVTIIRNATEVWNKYYAPVLGHENCNLLGIYSHMIDNPLYLSNYPYGHLVESQLEEYFKDKNIGTEVCRIYPVGRLTPNIWMKNAVGTSVSIEPLLRQTKAAINSMVNDK